MIYFPSTPRLTPRMWDFTTKFSTMHVTLHVWRIPRTHLPQLLWRMARDRSRLRAIPGVRFAKLLGVGGGDTFTPNRPDLTRWATLLVWDDSVVAAGFEATATARCWRRLAVGCCRLDLAVLASRGLWAGVDPFPAAGSPGTAGTPRASGTPRPAGTPRASGPADTGCAAGAAGTQDPAGPAVLALTRARLRPHRAAMFWRATAPVARAIADAPGLLATFGIGEAPIGWQGTISLWHQVQDLVEFAYRHPEHLRVIARTPVARWYAEELFARFAVVSLTGDRSVLGWHAGVNRSAERRGPPG